MAQRERVEPEASRTVPGAAARSAGLLGSTGPMAAALLLDVADLVTFGPIGAWTGLAVGLVLGWLLAPQLGLGGRRWLPALLSGLYLTTPGTALLPMAGLMTGVRSLLMGPKAPSSSAPAEVRPESPSATIEADYVSRWHDDPKRGSD